MIAAPAPVTRSATKRAILYLRVSTPRQMHTAVDIDPEGNSIATQREACLAKAHSLDAAVVAEFVEPGNSAQSIEKRPVFKQLLAYLEDHRDIHYVIVYMPSRAFPNSIDAAITKRALGMLGVRIISCNEDFGIGPVADARETVSDAFNELQVRQNGEDIGQKRRHKALNGGTISRAKLGYLNIRAESEGRLFNNSIGVDTKRAPLVRRAFELYATGEYSIDRLEATMADLGLTTRPSSRSPQEKPITDSKLHRMLSDPYYAGWVVLDGRLIKGRHEPIVSQALFDQVQEMLAARSSGGSRDRVLKHYLKGMLFCDRCHQRSRDSRLIYTEARGRNGQLYGYFLCRSRQDGECDLPHLPAWQVERAIEQHYRTLQVPENFAETVRHQLEATLADEQQLTREMHEQLTRQLAKLDAREQRLIDLAADGLLSRSKILERSNAIERERVKIQAGLADTGSKLALGAERLRECLDLVADPAGLYAQALDDSRRQLNGTFYKRFYVNDQPLGVAGDQLQPPFDEIRDARVAYLRRRPVSENLPTIDDVIPLFTESQHSRATGTDDQTSVLADIFQVSVSNKRVLVGRRVLTVTGSSSAAGRGQYGEPCTLKPRHHVTLSSTSSPSPATTTQRPAPIAAVRNRPTGDVR